MSGQASSSSTSYSGSNGSNAPIPATTPGKARKQAQAQRSRLVALSKHLMTRLQYANFKVEHGWAKQSLSEVENLYYRQNQGGTRGAVKLGTSASPSSGASKVSAPATPSVANVNPVTSRLFKDAATLKRPDGDGGDVFGGYGLATPPASGGTHPSSYFAGSKGSGSKGRAASFTPISPPGSVATASVLGEPLGSASTASSTKRSSPRGQNSSAAPWSAAAAASRPRTAATSAANSSGGHSGNTNGGVASYADFWSRVGSSATPTTTGAGTARSSALDPRPTHVAGVKRSADPSEDGMGVHPQRSESGAEAANEAGAGAGGGGGGGGSPLKRVRMDLSSTNSPIRGTSTESSPMLERGPSFAASARNKAQLAAATVQAELPRLARSGSPTPGART